MLVFVYHLKNDSLVTKVRVLLALVERNMAGIRGMLLVVIRTL